MALRKRFCRKFNFELQAAANEDAIVLSLGATHSFPLEEVFSYLNPKTVRNVLVQALLDAPMFNVRWRWNASTALAIQRRRGGVRVPPQIQRSQAEDLIALVFPDQLACLENISGEREVPDHPLVLQTIHDCLYEAMDIEELEKLLTDLRAGKLNLVAKDLREPSPMSQEILNARPYTFLDNAPLEERRTNAIKNRKWLDPSEAKELSHLDKAAIEAVKTESWPQITSPEELHDTLILFGFITEEEGNIGSNGQNWEQYLIQLIASGQATTLKTPNLQKIWIALERTEQFNLVFDQPKYQPELKISEELQKTLAQNNKCTDPMDALVEIIRGRLEALGPVTIEDLVASLGLPMEKIDQALVLLENDGFVFRGNFTPGLGQLEWCERRLLARINRYTLKRLRKEIEPVSPNDFMRFLFEWQHLNPLNQPEGPQALQKVLEQLEGVEAPAAAWESHILPSRIKDYDYLWLDVLCMSGKIIWGRFRPFAGNSNHLKGPTPIRTTPITLVDRNNLQLWSQLSDRKNGEKRELSDRARQIWEFLKQQGASFFNDLMEKNSMLKIKVEEAISELVSHGLVTSDSFTGLRALLVPTKYRLNSQRRRKKLLLKWKKRDDGH